MASALALVEALPHAAWVASVPGAVVLAANDAAARLVGQPREALVGAPAQQLVMSPEDLAWWAAAAEGHWAPLDTDTVIAAADGVARHVRRSIGIIEGRSAGQALALFSVFDREETRHAEAEREARLAELEATFESTADALLVTDLAGGLRRFNRRFAALWGVPEGMLRSHDDAAIGAWMQRSVTEPEAYGERLRALLEAPLVAATDRITLLNGTVLERASRPLWCQGRPQGRVWAYRDLSERLAAEARIEALATTDALTGLPNRRTLVARIDEATAAPGSSRGFALLVLDLDHFRQLNATFGHAVGDRVLQHASERLSSCLREHDQIARLGGDQFAIVLHEADANAAEVAARRMLNVMAQPSTLDDATFTLTCSIGIALWPSHGRSADELARHAEAAMRAAKQAGRANVRLHQMRAEVDRRAQVKLDHAMRQALVSGRFRLAYQPQVDLDSGAIIGAEALLRWRDPEMGEVSPGRFIPVAEESGFIVAIGDWVLAQAVRQAAAWQQRGHAMPVAVNVSALQFQQVQFVERVANVLAVSGLPAHLLELELTESILVHDAEEALARLTALQRLGVQMSIDDFGTGYSSLAYLKRFPISKLKIDRSFVRGLPADEVDAGIVRAILQMARALGMRVVAEGVETELQRAFLAAEGCAQMQGFLYAPALDPLSFEERMVTARSAETGTPASAEGSSRQLRLVSKRGLG